MTRENPHPFKKGIAPEGHPSELSDKRLEELSERKNHLDKLIRTKLLFNTLEASGNRIVNKNKEEFNFYELSDVEKEQSVDPLRKLTLDELQQESEKLGQEIKNGAVATKNFKQQLQSERIEGDISHQ